MTIWDTKETHLRNNEVVHLYWFVLKQGPVTKRLFSQAAPYPGPRAPPSSEPLL